MDHVVVGIAIIRNARRDGINNLMILGIMLFYGTFDDRIGGIDALSTHSL